MFSLIPIALMALFVMSISASLLRDAAERMEKQQTFDKLVSVADYVVKSGAARSDGGSASDSASGLVPSFVSSSVHYPNWIDESKLDSLDVEKLRTDAGLASLFVSSQRPESIQKTSSGAAASVCIYRLVVFGDDKRIGRIFVCGG